MSSEPIFQIESTYGHPSEGLARITPAHIAAARKHIDETPDRLIADLLEHVIAYIEIRRSTNLLTES